jgi:flagellar hook protein FlgE
MTELDVRANNIANVNTTGYKGSTATFADLLSQVLQGATAPNGQPLLGGTNPAQIGLGVKVTKITPNFAQGALDRTGRVLDVAIQGDGFFVVAGPDGDTYTRAGSLSIDGEGRLVTPTGGFIQGWQADAVGQVDTNAPIGRIAIAVGSLLEPQETTSLTLSGNLPATAAIGETTTIGVNVFDTQGSPIPVQFTFTKSAADTWDITGTQGTPPVAIAAFVPNQLTFDANGELLTPAGFSFSFNIPGVGAITAGLGAPGQAGRISQYASPVSAAVVDQDGYGAGALQGLAVGQDGVIVGSYSNGRTRAIGQLAMANFANPEGLEKVGNTSFRQTLNSGLPLTGPAGLGGRGLFIGGALEMSNVDLTAEFPGLIRAQRGFQANTRVMTTADEVLQELVNLKR